MKTFYLIGILALIVSCSSSDDMTNEDQNDAYSSQVSAISSKSSVGSSSSSKAILHLSWPVRVLRCHLKERMYTNRTGQ